MKKDKIFAFKNYQDFQSKYFNKGLVAFEDLNRAKYVNQARNKYSKRFQSEDKFF